MKEKRKKIVRKNIKNNFGTWERVFDFLIDENMEMQERIEEVERTLFNIKDCIRDISD